MDRIKTIEGKKCYLKLADSESASTKPKWFNDINISMPESNIYEVISEKNIWFGELAYSIFDKESNTNIGEIELYTDEDSSSASLGIIIGERDYWGKGYGKEAILLIMDMAFNKLNKNNLMLGVYGFNKRAISLYKHLGFKEIGRKREYQAIGGRRFDMILMDMLSREFKELYSGTL